VADTSPGGALLFFPSYSATRGANTAECTVAGDKILDYLVVLPRATASSDALINTSPVTHIPGIVRSLFRAPIENGRVLNAVI
jgi:hypothetical protein